MIFGIMFYMFATLTILGSFLTLAARIPVYSILWLIFTFLNASGLFVLLGSELLAMIFIIVYVGAVAVLFLFVVMMILPENQRPLKKMPISKKVALTVGIFLGGELLVIMTGWSLMPITYTMAQHSSKKTLNMSALGNVLYTYYGILFQLSGFILLSAMVGAIILTSRPRKEIRSQKISESCSKTKKRHIKICQIDLEKGI